MKMRLNVRVTIENYRVCPEIFESLQDEEDSELITNWLTGRPYDDALIFERKLFVLDESVDEIDIDLTTW